MGTSSLITDHLHYLYAGAYQICFQGLFHTPLIMFSKDITNITYSVNVQTSLLLNI